MSTERIIQVTRKMIREAGFPFSPAKNLTGNVQGLGLEIVGTHSSSRGTSVFVRGTDWRMLQIRKTAPHNGETPACREFMAGVLARLERIEELTELLYNEWKAT